METFSMRNQVGEYFSFSNNSFIADVDFTENHTEEGDEETRRKRGMKKREKQEFVSRRQHIMYEVQKRDHDKERKYHPVCFCSPFWSKFQLSSDVFQILSAGKLGQLYSIDHCLRVLRQRDDTFRKCCIELRGTKENTLRFNIMKMKAAKKVSTAINSDL